jgi:multidrug efflux pump subunit AcrB
LEAVRSILHQRSLPSAGVGALLALMAFKTEFSIMALTA